MPVVAKLGVIKNPGKVRTDAGTFPVTFSPAGGFVVGAPAEEAPGLVRYDEVQHVLEIQRPGVSLFIRFRPQTEHTMFTYGGRTYEVGTMELGRVDIAQEGRRVVRGYVTLSGVRLESVAPELQPIERELAFGLALHDAWSDDWYPRDGRPLGHADDGDE